MFSIKGNTNYFSVWERENTLSSNKFFFFWGGGGGTRGKYKKDITQQRVQNEFRRLHHGNIHTIRYSQIQYKCTARIKLEISSVTQKLSLCFDRSWRRNDVGK